MKRFYLFALAAMLFVACTTDQTTDIVVNVPETLTVSFEEDSRIQLDDAQKTVWTEGDLVSVFYKSDANDCWKFTGETGDRTATLQRISKGDGVRKGDNVIVAYPYNEEYIISLSANTLEAKLPALQTYHADSYGIGSSPMVGFGDYKQFVLKSVCGWLKVQLTGNGEIVDKLTLRGNNGEQVAGSILIVAEDASSILASASADIDDTEVGGSLILKDDIQTEVTLDCGEGVTLGEKPTAFYIALPPQTFDRGLMIEITTVSGDKMTKSTDNEICIERNAIQPMGNVEYEKDVPTNQIWYTSTDGKIVKPYMPSAFGTNIISNTYENGKGVITFEEEITTIGSKAFQHCKTLKTVYLPNSLTTIGYAAFENCDKMSNILIPYGVTDIGQSAFTGCDEITNLNIPGSVANIDKYAFSSCVKLETVTLGNKIESIATGTFYNCHKLTSIDLPDKLTSIGKFTFENCYALSDVTIPETVTFIDNSAFANCRSLLTINIPEEIEVFGENIFSGCSGLSAFYGAYTTADHRCVIVDDSLVAFAPYGIRQYVIPDGVKVINDTVFMGIGTLESVTIPESVEKIGRYAFAGCASLATVNIQSTTINIEELAFFHCSNLVAFYGTHASHDNRCLVQDNTLRAFAPAGIDEYQIPSDITKLEHCAFAGVVLNKIIVPETIVDTEEEAFYHCQIEELEVHCNVISKFSTATTINYLKFGENIKIDYMAFYDCKISNITIPDSVETNETVFYNCYGEPVINWNKISGLRGSAFTSITIADGVTSIGNNAFYGCSSLTSITIPDSVTSIGGSAFSGCSSLTAFYGKFASEDNRCLIVDGVLNSFAIGCGATSYTIPNSVTSIGDNAFYGCSSLTSVTIPDSVTSIGEWAFSSCFSLKEVYCKPTTPPTMYYSGAFSGNASGRKFYVPASDDDSVINAYKAADGWKRYASYIEEYDFSAE